jgi:hypothetical protein
MQAGRADTQQKPVRGRMGIRGVLAAESLMGRTMPTASSTVSVIDYSKFAALDERLRKRRAAAAFKKGYETWERYDAAIRKVMRHHGKSVGWDADVDFYHGGDWFHELYDGFALMTTTALSIPLLHDLQEVVTRHHPEALLSFGGEVSTPMLGLDVLVTPTQICAAWYENTAATCRRKIKKTGVQIL